MNNYESESESEYETESDKDDESSDDPVNLLTFFTRKELYYYKMIDKFFKKCDKEKIKKMLDIIDGSSTISLRVLDWFITRYSKKNVNLGGSTDNLIDIFDVHISYKAQLKSFRKKYFDPFRRRKKFNYYYDPIDANLKMNTTLGQLNFFQWAIVHNIIGYVEKNLETILKEMNSCNKEDKKKKDLKKKLKIKSNSKKEILLEKKKAVNTAIDNNNNNNKIIINFN